MRAAVIDISMLSALTISPPENERDWPEAANIAVYRQRVILLLKLHGLGSAIHGSTRVVHRSSRVMKELDGSTTKVVVAEIEMHVST